MKKYINGYDKPQFIIMWGDRRADETVEISFKYQALREYYEELSTTDIYTDGSKTQKIHFYNYEWRLFFTDSIEKDDRLKIAKVEKAISSGYRVVLIPHKDIPWRFFDILLNPERKEHSMFSHFRGRESTTNYNFEISFVNKNTIRELNVWDSDFIPVVSALVYQEF